jgi:UDP-N-acetylglucosamine--N-acetylmuramyl-(pentapeptide) pyrophosphoryl-undecaprenol N-acetylglucosamine transferase
MWVGAFIDRMDYAYEAADLVVSRAGAMAIAELSVMKKPVIFVPYPFAAEDHQTVNAQYLVSKKAALFIPDNQVAGKLTEAVINLAEDAGKREELKNNIGKLAILSADETVAEAVIYEIEKNRNEAEKLLNNKS